MSATIPRPTIILIRETNILTDQLVQHAMAALQIQIDRDYVPIWGGPGAELMSSGPNDPIPRDAWQMALLDNSDQADALGYHDVTSTGLPVGKVFVADCLRDGLNWNVTLSHELIEMLGDPDVSKTVTVTSKGVTYEYARELCDACEDDTFAYPINGHMMSDFVRPTWFDLNGQAPYTFRLHTPIHAPFALARGGYIGRRETAPTPADWGQVFAGGEPGARAVNKSPQSRTMRRFHAKG